jgi:predicted nucleic acid-binding protein
VRARARPSISDLTEVELLSAVAGKVRGRDLAPADGSRISAEFLSHLEGNLYTRLPIERRHYRLARDWMAQLATPLRALDALHLAVAAVDGLTLATADRVLSRWGRLLGVRVLPVGPAKGSRHHAP